MNCGTSFGCCCGCWPRSCARTAVTAACVMPSCGPSNDMNELRLEVVFTNTLKIQEVIEPPAGRSFVTVVFEQFTITAEGSHVMYTLPVDHTVLMQVTYTDAKGNPATIDGDVSWQSSDASIAAVQVDSGDSTICRI